MSVNKLPKKEIERIKDSLIDLLYKDQHIARAVAASGVFRDKFYWKYQGRKKIQDEEQIEINEKHLKESIIERLCWYLHVANSVAYALQYREQPAIEFDEVKDKYGLFSNRSSLLNAMKNVAYNIHTNDGHYFLSQEWEELFDSLLHVLQVESGCI